MASEFHVANKVAYHVRYTQHILADDLGDTGIDWSLTSHPIPGHRVIVELFVPHNTKFEKDTVSLIMSGMTSVNHNQA